MCERMSYYGIASNLVLYLTRELHEGTVKSANNVTNWAGFVWMAPIFGAYIADAHLGRYRTFVMASGIYVLVNTLNSLTYINEYSHIYIYIYESYIDRHICLTWTRYCHDSLPFWGSSSCYCCPSLISHLKSS